MTRAAVGLGGPVAVGVMCGRGDLGTLVAFGVFPAILADQVGSYRKRLVRLVPQAFANAAGCLLGTLLAGYGWMLVAVLTALAVMAGAVSRIGSITSTWGMNALVAVVIWSGVPSPEPGWLTALLLLAGSLIVAALALAAWPLRGLAPERGAVAEVYEAIGDTLATRDRDAAEAAAGRARAAFKAAYEMVILHRPRPPRKGGPAGRLVTVLNAASPLLETAHAHSHHPAAHAPEHLAMLREVAQAVREGRHAIPPKNLPKPLGPTQQALARGLSEAAAATRTNANGALVNAQLGMPEDAWRLRGDARKIRSVLRSGPSWTYAASLGLCVGIAAALARIPALERSYWIALTVVFVLKPDFGSVFVRALLRALGTALGVLIAAAVIGWLPRSWTDAVVLAALGACLSLGILCNYGWQTAFLTAAILLLTERLTSAGAGALVPVRMQETAIGCAIVLVFGYLLWPEHRGRALRQATADAYEAIAAYLALLPGPTPTGSRERALRRRTMHAAIGHAQSVLDQTLAEPPISHRAAHLAPVVAQTGRVAAAVAATMTSVDGGAAPPTPDEVTVHTGELHSLTHWLRGAQPPKTVTPPHEDRPLAPLTAALAETHALLAAETAAQPREKAHTAARWHWMAVGTNGERGWWKWLMTRVPPLKRWWEARQPDGK
ncbi:FUSC family protein [Streptomyces sp. S186]|uniref:FUSC family protein n=1 Tax=Streptomyces sp. S186 TaxID=3434395 RepID=UPI003F66B1C4